MKIYNVKEAIWIEDCNKEINIRLKGKELVKVKPEEKVVAIIMADRTIRINLRQEVIEIDELQE